MKEDERFNDDDSTDADALALIERFGARFDHRGAERPVRARRSRIVRRRSIYDLPGMAVIA